MIVSCTYQVIQFAEDDFEILDEGFEYKAVEMSVEDFYLTVKYWERSTSSTIERHDHFSSDFDFDIHDGTQRQECLHIDLATPAELLELNHLVGK